MAEKYRNDVAAIYIVSFDIHAIQCYTLLDYSSTISFGHVLSLLEMFFQRHLPPFPMKKVYHVHPDVSKFLDRTCLLGRLTAADAKRSYEAGVAGKPNPLNSYFVPEIYENSIRHLVTCI